MVLATPNWLNKVEYCIPHLGGPFGHIENCSGAIFRTRFGPKGVQLTQAGVGYNVKLWLTSLEQLGQPMAKMAVLQELSKAPFGHL